MDCGNTEREPEKEEAIIRKEFNISPDVALEDVNLFEGKDGSSANIYV